jgi:hypothetical protein
LLLLLLLFLCCCCCCCCGGGGGVIVVVVDAVSYLQMIIVTGPLKQHFSINNDQIGLVLSVYEIPNVVLPLVTGVYLSNVSQDCGFHPLEGFVEFVHHFAFS